MSRSKETAETKADARLIIGASETDANIYYATRFFAPDPFVFIEKAGKTYALLNDLEIDRARSQARVDEVVSLSEWLKRAEEAGHKERKLLDALHLLLQELAVKTVQVPGSMAVEHADGLRDRGYDVLVKRGTFFEERLVKSPEELEAISEVLRLTEAALDEAVDVLKRAKVAKDGSLLSDDRRSLTSEALRRVIGSHLLEHECLAANTIVAGGEQAADPHERGHGPLRAGEPIIIDVFPRSQTTGYFADISRTFIKGKASDGHKAMYEAVLEGMEIAFKLIRDGADGQAIHQAVLELFDSRGFPTGERDGRMQGFFHGTGHGLGLEVHEPPRISRAPDTLKNGMVVTVEPGLYYAGKGGVRVEDLVVVGPQGCRNLTSYPKFLEI